jgi:hypothetical protein
MRRIVGQDHQPFPDKRKEISGAGREAVAGEETAVEIDKHRTAPAENIGNEHNAGSVARICYTLMMAVLGVTWRRASGALDGSSGLRKVNVIKVPCSQCRSPDFGLLTCVSAQVPDRAT